MGESFLGTPAFEVRGSIALDRGATPSMSPQALQLSLFWIGFDSRDLRRPVLEQHAALDNDFGSFRMTLFDRPPDVALTFDAFVPDDVAVGFALIVLYADNNDNGLLNSANGVNAGAGDGPDAVLGASASHLIVYARDPVPASSVAGQMLGPLSAGYHLFANDSGSTCPFTQSRGCVGRGRLMRVEDPASATIVLTLHPEPGQVLVPNPEIPGPGSGTSESDNLYNAGG